MLEEYADKNSSSSNTTTTTMTTTATTTPLSLLRCLSLQVDRANKSALANAAALELGSAGSTAGVDQWVAPTATEGEGDNMPDARMDQIAARGDGEKATLVTPAGKQPGTGGERSTVA